MNWRDYIERNPAKMLGKPVFVGTRITVQHVLERLAQGSSESDLLASHPSLKPEHLRAALAFAADSMATDEVLVVEPLQR